MDTVGNSKSSLPGWRLLIQRLRSQKRQEPGQGSGGAALLAPSWQPPPLPAGAFGQERPPSHAHSGHAGPSTSDSPHTPTHAMAVHRSGRLRVLTGQAHVDRDAPAAPTAGA